MAELRPARGIAATAGAAAIAARPRNGSCCASRARRRRSISDRPAGGAHTPEFDAWRWERLEALPDLVVPFKRAVYEKVVAQFAPLAKPA